LFDDVASGGKADYFFFRRFPLKENGKQEITNLSKSQTKKNTIKNILIHYQLNQFFKGVSIPKCTKKLKSNGYRSVLNYF